MKPSQPEFGAIHRSKIHLSCQKSSTPNGNDALLLVRLTVKIVRLRGIPIPSKLSTADYTSQCVPNTPRRGGFDVTFHMHEAPLRPLSHWLAGKYRMGLVSGVGPMFEAHNTPQTLYVLLKITLNHSFKSKYSRSHAPPY